MAILDRCEKINLTLNQEKCQLSVPRVSYIGHILSADGVQPHPEKVKAIREMPPPTDKKGIERLLGTINHLAKFTPNMSTVTHPIRKLLKSDVMFCWRKSQEAFDKSTVSFLQTWYSRTMM